MTYKYNEKTWNKDCVEIAQRVRNWSADIIEQSSTLFQGGPPCPFARKAWLQHKVMIHVTPDLDAVVEVKAAHPPEGDMTYLFVWTGWDEISQDDFSDWIFEQNENHFGTWLAAIHPGGHEGSPLGVSDDKNIFSQVDDICIILMQEYQHLVEASKALQKTGYYNNYTEAEMGVLKDREEKFYAWKRQTSGHHEAEEEEGFIEH